MPAWHAECCVLTAIVTPRLEHIDPEILSAEPLFGLAELARAVGADGIARDAGRLDHGARGDRFREKVFDALCVRLHHHIETMWQALAWAGPEEQTRCHSLSICRLLCESVLERSDYAFAAARVHLARWLAVERRKFLMSSIADAQTIGWAALDALRRRIRREVETSIASITEVMLRELYAAFGDLSRSIPELVFVLLDVEALDRPPRASLPAAWSIERDVHAVLVGVLEAESQRAVDDELDRYDHARAELEARVCELIDDAITSTRTCGAFARAVKESGPSRTAEMRDKLRSWAAVLDRLIGQIPSA